MQGMSSPAVRPRLFALRIISPAVLRDLWADLVGLAQEWVISLRERTARLQVHPTAVRLASSRPALVTLAAAGWLGAVLLMLAWAEVAYLSGDLIMGNLLRLMAGMAVSFVAVMTIVAAIFWITGVLQLRRR